MKGTATAEFDVTGWDETPYDETDDGPHLARVTVRKAYRGDLEAESETALLTCQADPDDYSVGAGYVASERITGTLEGRSGTFVIQHGGISGHGRDDETFGHVVPRSGTGALSGLSGTVEISLTEDGGHVLTLAYELCDDSTEE